MNGRRALLIYDTDRAYIAQLRAVLGESYRLLVAQDEKQIDEMIESEQISTLFFNEVSVDKQPTLEAMMRFRSRHPEVPVVVLTDHPTVESAVEVMRLGAHHYGSKTVKVGELSALIEKTHRDSLLQRDYERIRKELSRMSGKIVGKSSEIRRIQDQIRRVAMTDVTVLLMGESGTGKELVAQEIHTASHRNDRPFVAVNCASLVKGLIESELFGHQRGSFTGALQNKMGKFELANSGTIFLDEIADLDLQSQVKLLRVLQEKVVDRVGGSSPIPVDSRVIAATNRNLAEMTARGEFREDLYYRLNIFPIHLPPLRDLKEDIPMLAQYYLGRYGSELGKPNLTFSPSAMEYLVQYGWPGNVRELQNTIQRAILFCGSTRIEPIDLPTEVTQRKVSALSDTPLPVIEKQARDAAARLAIVTALEQTGWNVKKSAKILSIPEKTLYDKCSNLGIKLRRTVKS